LRSLERDIRLASKTIDAHNSSYFKGPAVDIESARDQLQAAREQVLLSRMMLQVCQTEQAPILRRLSELQERHDKVDDELRRYAKVVKSRGRTKYGDVVLFRDWWTQLPS